MDLTLQDKNELLKAAIRCTDKATADWLVSIVEKFDAASDGKRIMPCPAFATASPASSRGTANGTAPQPLAGTW